MDESHSTQDARKSSDNIPKPDKSAFRDDIMESEHTPNPATFNTSRFAKREFGGRSFRRRASTVQCEDDMTSLRMEVGLYEDYPLASSLLRGASTRQNYLQLMGQRQQNHVKSTEGWFKTMFILSPRAIDNYLVPWLVIILNALICTVVCAGYGYTLNDKLLDHWDNIYSLVLKTSLAFLLVFRLNRAAIQYWEARTMWGNVTLETRGLVSGILTHLQNDLDCRDQAVCWTAAFAIATMHFIRGEAEIPKEELAGFLGRHDIIKLQESNHSPLYATTRVRYFLKRGLPITPESPAGIAQSRAIQMNLLEEKVNELIAQVSGMEKIRSTPLPIVYVTHLRTFLFCYLFTLPYVWVSERDWATIPLVALTAFALMGIEGAASECEIPFRRDRPNHLSLDASCAVMMNNIQDLVVQVANLDMQEKQDGLHNCSSDP